MLSFYPLLALLSVTILSDVPSPPKRGSVMADSSFVRKRAALSTVGRGSRALCILSAFDQQLIFAGTTIAHSQNSLHALHFDENTSTITPYQHFSTPHEIWSLQPLHVDPTAIQLVAGVRDAHESRVEIWSLNDPQTHLENLTASADTQQFPVSVKAKSSLSAHIIHIRQRPSSRNYLCVTQSGAAVIDVGQDLNPINTFSLENSEQPCKVVDGDWISDKTALIASRNLLATFDVRSGACESQLDTSQSLKLSKPQNDNSWVPPHASRISSACSDRSHLFYIGTQNGSLRAFDNRTEKLVWEVRDAHSQWVSVTRMLPSGAVLSGGTDGVVRCWTAQGESIETFPQHDDTVTNVAVSDSLLTTVSYDGRIAINDVPLSHS